MLSQVAQVEFPEGWGKQSVASFDPTIKPLWLLSETG